MMKTNSFIPYASSVALLFWGGSALSETQSTSTYYYDRTIVVKDNVVLENNEELQLISRNQNSKNLSLSIDSSALNQQEKEIFNVNNHESNKAIKPVYYNTKIEVRDK